MIISQAFVLYPACPSITPKNISLTIFITVLTSAHPISLIVLHNVCNQCNPSSWFWTFLMLALLRRASFDHHLYFSHHYTHYKLLFFMLQSCRLCGVSMPIVVTMKDFFWGFQERTYFIFSRKYFSENLSFYYTLALYS